MKTLYLFTAVLLFALMLLRFGFAPEVHAASLTVDSTANIIANDGDCTLREAIINANNDDQSGPTDCAAGSGADTIILASEAIYTLDRFDNIDPSDGPSGLPQITSEITIEGNGATIERSSVGIIPSFRIFFVQTDGDLTLEGLTVRNGLVSSFDGGGILSKGKLTVTNSTVSNNSGRLGGGILNLRGEVVLLNNTIRDNSGNFGAGIANDGGPMTLTNSVVSSNESIGFGGGMWNSGTLTMINSALIGNSANADGGGIKNLYMLTITNSIVSGNSAGGNGGGIRNQSTSTITNSTVNGNSADENGGGIWNNGVLTVIDSTISDNTASNGGGIMNFYTEASFTMENGTVSGNSADDDGGGIYDLSGVIAVLTNVTITNNSTGSSGGGIWDDGFITLKNTVLAENTASVSGPDCSVEFPLQSGGHNLVGNVSGCTFLPAAGDLIGTGESPIDPMLGPLQFNGGPTFTHALEPGSPAINAGDNASCPDTDQRGVERPQGANCDIGAYEFEFGPASTDVSITKTDSPDPASVGNVLTYTLTATNHGPATTAVVTLTDTLPVEVTFSSVTPSQGTCGESEGNVTCDLGNINMGDTATVVIEVIPNSAGIITNTASVQSDVFDLDPTNNSDTENTTVHPACFGFAPTIIGTEGFDILIGTDGPDVIVGLGGNDIIVGLGGNDIICGGLGNDLISGGDGNDLLIGNAGNDIIDGGAGNDLLVGNAGDDMIAGRSGNDLIACGPGSDIADGGADADFAIACELQANIP